MTYDPNQAMSGDLFNESDLNAVGSTELVAEGEYQLELTGRFNKKNGGIVFVDGKILAGQDAGKKVDLFSVVFHKTPGQKSIGLQNLAAIGIDIASLNQLSKQVGAGQGNMEPLYEALAPNISGRTINAYLVHNTFDGKNGEQTKMQLKIGEASLIGPAPALVVTAGTATPTPTPTPTAGGAAPATPAVAAPVPAAAPVVAPVAPAAVAPAPAPAAPAVAPVAAPAVAPVPAPVAPVVAPAVSPQAVPAQNEAAPAPVQPVAGQVPVVGEPGF